MNSRIRRIYSFISTIIFIILIPLLILDVIPTLFGLIILGLAFLIMNVVLPVVEVRETTKEYNRSLSDPSLTTLTIKANNINESEFNSDIKKYYPKNQVNLVIFIFSMALLGIVTIVLSLLLPHELPVEIIYLILISIFVMLFFGLIYLTPVVKKPFEIDEKGIKAMFRDNLDLTKKERYERINFIDIIQINIKKNKYVYHKDVGVIFEFVMNDGLYKILNTQVFSDKQRLEIISILKNFS